MTDDEIMRAAVIAMFNQSGCDCDSNWMRARHPAPYHASECPVVVRYEPLERKLRGVAARLKKGGGRSPE